MAISDGLSSLLFPYGLKCPFCGSVAPRKNDPLCKSCRQEIDSLLKGLRPCIKCGRFIPHNQYFCDECEDMKDFPFALARAATIYSGKMKEQIHLFKYLGKRSLAEPFSSMMLKTFKTEKTFLPVDSIVAIPLHENRLQERTFNQAEDLAIALAKKLKKPYLENLLWRVVDTPTQVSLNKEQRNKNLQGAFVVTNPEQAAGKNILLVDDIFTTGTTISVVSKLLLGAGAERVVALTLATGDNAKYAKKRQKY